MSGTVKTDFTAITHSATAKSTLASHAQSVDSLVSVINVKIDELKVLLKALQANYPSGGGDASNFTALTTVLNELT